MPSVSLTMRCAPSEAQILEVRQLLESLGAIWSKQVYNDVPCRQFCMVFMVWSEANKEIIKNLQIPNWTVNYMDWDPD
jgi:hypothetical protein